jgi:hypothetical protein
MALDGYLPFIKPASRIWSEKGIPRLLSGFFAQKFSLMKISKRVFFNMWRKNSRPAPYYLGTLEILEQAGSFMRRR